MRKMLVAILILALLGVASGIEQKAIGNIADTYTQKIDLICERLRRNESDVQSLILNFEQEWEKSEAVLDVLTPHDDTDEINIDLSRFKSYLESGDKYMAMNALGEMTEHFKEIRKKTRINLTNIF